MASCHLVTDGDLSLPCDVDLCHLHDSVGEFVADFDLVELPLGAGLGFLVGDAVVVDQFADEFIHLLVRSPLVGIDVHVVDSFKYLHCEFLALRDDFDSVEVAYA